MPFNPDRMKPFSRFLAAALCIAAELAFVASGHASWLADRWPGLSYADAKNNPPDPHGAAGPSGLILTVNGAIAYRPKASSSYVWGPINYGTFFAPAGNAGSGNGDPKVLFDRGTQRFFLLVQEDADPDVSFINIAVSRNADPRTFTGSDWHFYRVPMRETLLGEDFWGDYPCLGLDGRAFYVTFNMFPFPMQSSDPNPIEWENVADHGQMFIFNKADLVNGTLSYRSFDVPTGFTLQPASVLSSSTPGNKAYFAQIDSPATARIWVLNNPLGNPILVPFGVPIPVTGTPALGAPQILTDVRLDTVTPFKAQGNAFWYDGSVWFCYTGASPDGRAKVWYYQVATHAEGLELPVPLLKQAVMIPGDSDTGWTMQPAIGANSRGDVCIVYIQTSGSETPTIKFTTIPHYFTTLAPFESPQTLVSSPTHYEGPAQTPNQSTRWGDYASVSADPSDDSFWIVHEYSRGFQSQLNWGTYWGHVVVPQHVIYVDKSNGCLRPEDLAWPFSKLASYVPGWSWGTREGLGVVLDPRNPPEGAPTLPCPPDPLPCTLPVCLGGPFKDIDSALKNATSGDMLEVRSGNYNEKPRINQHVFISAKGGSVFIGKP